MHSGWTLLATLLLLSACNLTDEYNADNPPERPASYVASDADSYKKPTSAGEILTTPDGMTVYTYDNEAANSPSCYGKCADDWTAVLAPEGAKPFGKLSIVDRTDGKKQWAYAGRALYVYDGDQAPGDVKGDNHDGLWHVVK